MFDILVNIMATVSSGCLVALFTHWLRHRNDNK
ncbi:type I toxin-antitoxin system Fst family toxin [Staphylococcus warneri]|nr:type I toxin-antitoxin system Fst family toxin [Staphylococcus warneri]QNQ45848.1 type I toxin-antitoxin system Fst family toxin [Staphylococcus warneri]